MSATLIMQKAIRDRFVASPALIALVPADHVLDRNARPNPDPSVIIGEGQKLPGGDIARRTFEVIFDIHVWRKEPGLTGVKAIVGAMRTALHSSRPILPAGYHCGDCHVSSARYLRDPDGETSHAVMTVSALVGEV